MPLSRRDDAAATTGSEDVAPPPGHRFATDAASFHSRVPGSMAAWRSTCSGMATADRLGPSVEAWVAAPHEASAVS